MIMRMATPPIAPNTRGEAPQHCGCKHTIKYSPDYSHDKAKKGTNLCKRQNINMLYNGHFASLV